MENFNKMYRMETKIIRALLIKKLVNSKILFKDTKVHLSKLKLGEN